MTLVLSFLLSCGLIAGAPSGLDDRIRPAQWQPVQPPRSGLRCWRSLSIGDGVVYCELDPSATFGASHGN